MKIGILGTRGIPNNYGGFEQFAQFLSKGLVERGLDVSVYNSHNHPFQEKNWHGVNIFHQYDPEYLIGQAGQFIYDLNCTLDSRKRGFDVILQLGYTTNSIWGWLLPRKSAVLFNMDGIEWERSKYNKFVRKFLKYAEKLGVKYSQELIADSKVIQEYYRDKYQKTAFYIPYGADIPDKPNPGVLIVFDLKPYDYNLIIARLQPDNNAEMILSGLIDSQTDKQMLVIGKHTSPYGQYLRDRFKDKRIRFFGGIFDIDILNSLRYYSNIYFHGHSAGGTNPSLLEAMAASGFICAFNSPYHKAVLENNALYFENKLDITDILNEDITKSDYKNFIDNNLKAIDKHYSWDKIINDYYNCFKRTLENNNR